MIKIRFPLICLIFAFSESSQNKQTISIDSLDIIYRKNYRLSTKLSPIEFTNTAHDFLKLLDTQKKVYKTFNGLKIILFIDAVSYTHLTLPTILLV